MGLRTTLTFTCDYAGCKGSKTGPAVVEYNKEAVEAGQVPVPEEAKYMVIFNQGGTVRTFCCQLHAAESFLPPGYEAVQRKVVEIPKSEKFAESTLPWFRRPEQDERTVISRSESDPVPQADGDAGPDNGLEGEPI